MTESIPNQLKNIILNAVKKCYPEREIPPFTVELPPAHISGDFATNIAMVLAKKLKCSPQEISNKLSEQIKNSTSLIEKTEFVKPGFINFSVAQSRFHQELEIINKKKNSYGRETLKNSRLVQIEFVSANPTGPLHIGHGRGAVIGDTLANILEARGWGVEREYYINDVGRQIDILEESVRNAKGAAREGNFYQGNYIKEIANEFFTSELPDTPGNLREFAVSRILGMIRQDLDKFGVRFNNWFSEKQLYANQEVEKVVAALRERNFIYEKDGAWWFKSTSWGDDKDRVVRRKNGEWTYFASDLAYLKNKFGRKYDKVINIWGSDHHGYEARIKASAQAMGYNADNVKIIFCQLVKLWKEGQPVTMSTRKGEFVTLKEVIQEVGSEATRFFLLMRKASSQLDFDLELAKKQNLQNPIYYIQYAHARISSVFKEKDKRKIPFSKSPQLALLKKREEIQLLKDLSCYPYIIELCARQLEPHWLTGYLQNLAKDFHSYYDKYRVLGEDAALTGARLALLEGVRIVLKNALGLMGITARERM